MYPYEGYDIGDIEEDFNDLPILLHGVQERRKPLEVAQLFAFALIVLYDRYLKLEVVKRRQLEVLQFVLTKPGLCLERV